MTVRQNQSRAGSRGLTTTVSRHLWRSALLFPVFALWGCGSGTPPAPTPAEEISSSQSAVIDYGPDPIWTQASLRLDEAKISVQQLQASIAQFLQQPSSTALHEVQNEWRLSHRQLLQLSPYFTLATVNPALFQQLGDSEWLLDAHPIEPGYLDYFDIYRYSGVVNDTVIPISANAIRQQHGFSSELDITLGMHAMEFLLWGEHGMRPSTDFSQQLATETQQKQGITESDLPSNRRALLLQLQGQLLLEELEALKFKFVQPASALNQAFANLAPGDRQHLWQQTAAALLADIAPLQTPPESASAPLPHSPYAGDELGTAYALLVAVIRVLEFDASGTSLLKTLIPDQADEFGRELDALKQELQAALQEGAQVLSEAHRHRLAKLESAFRAALEHQGR